MDLIVLDRMVPDIDSEGLAEKLRVAAGGKRLTGAFRRMVGEAVEVVEPKAAYKLVSCDEGVGDTVVMDGVVLRSRVLAVNLKEVYRAFPFVATCGWEIAEWAHSKTDMMEQFWAEAIMDRVLDEAIRLMDEHIKRLYRIESTAVMTPGSLDDWPIQEQVPLFAILGDIKGSIGVGLSEGLMMDPVHSVSGIMFPTDVEFEECELCPRQRCPKRRAAYDEHLYESRYAED